MYKEVRSWATWRLQQWNEESVPHVEGWDEATFISLQGDEPQHKLGDILTTL